MFQFPSNGKVYSKSKQSGIPWVPTTDSVSIPFKRESVFKEIASHEILEHLKEFQFPSNGKVYSKPGGDQDFFGAKIVNVSIPFKRESVFKVKRRKK